MKFYILSYGKIKFNAQFYHMIQIIFHGTSVVRIKFILQNNLLLKKDVQQRCPLVRSLFITG